MDWNASHRPFVSQPENSFSFLYNYNYDQFPGSEMKHPIPMVAHGVIERNNNSNSNSNSNDGNIVERKKRLTNEQLESLESSFQEEIKLDPDRKMKLAHDLGLHPRQVAVWFQNRRARWKAKQLETLYHSLKQEFDVVSTQKQNLQQEVVALRAILKEQATSKKQISTGYTEMSGEETVERTSVGMPMISNRCRGRGTNNNHHQNIVGECNYEFNVVDDRYNPVMVAPPYWGVLPSFP